VKPFLALAATPCAFALLVALRIGATPAAAQATAPLVGPPAMGSAVTYRMSWKVTEGGDAAGDGAVLVALRWRTADRIVATIQPAPGGTPDPYVTTTPPPAIYVVTRSANGVMTLDHLYADDKTGARLADAIGTLNDLSLMLAARPANAAQWTISLALRPQAVSPSTPPVAMPAVVHASASADGGALVLTGHGTETVKPGGSKASQLLQRLSGEGDPEPVTTAAELHARFAASGDLETASVTETTTTGSGKDAHVVARTWDLARTL
jgi:hypothetical protein